jgi:tetratricopeptide (TPR) repeat protein
MQKIILSAYLLLLPFSLFSQSPVSAAAQATGGSANAPYWYKLEQGKHLFRAGNYGEALSLFEDARNERAQMYEDYRAAVLSLLSLPEVRAMQDNLDRITAFAKERYYEAASAAFAELFFRVSREELSGTASASLDLFDQLKAYPEAEFWIGEVYRVEGAAPIAIKQYEKALAQADRLSDPAVEINILYQLAAFQKASGNYNEMEMRLYEILENDSLWSQDASHFVKNAMQRTLENDGVDRFLTMYRYKNAVTEKAHRLLAEYFYQSGRHLRAAEHYLFAWTIASSTIIEAYQAALIDDFRFSTLSSVTGGLARLPDVRAYMNEVDYYRNCYYLGAALYGAGKERAARSVWSYLAGEEAAGEWRIRAQRQLRSPAIEQPTPLP